MKTKVYRKVSRESEIDASEYIKDHFFSDAPTSKVSFEEKIGEYREKLLAYPETCIRICLLKSRRSYMPMVMLRESIGFVEGRPGKEFARCWLTLAFACLECVLTTARMRREFVHGINKIPASVKFELQYKSSEIGKPLGNPLTGDLIERLVSILDSGEMLSEEEILRRFDTTDVFEVYKKGGYGYSPKDRTFSYLIKCLDVLIPTTKLVPRLMDLIAFHVKRQPNVSFMYRMFPLAHLNRCTFEDPVTKQREELICDHVLWSEVEPLQTPSRDNIKPLLDAIPSRRLYGMIMSLHLDHKSWIRRTPYYLTLSSDEILSPRSYGEERKLPEEELNLLVARTYEIGRSIYQELTQLFNTQRKKYYTSREDTTLADVLAKIHDPEMIPYMYELTRKGYYDMKPYLEQEGANAIEGLVAMCTRKSAKQDFAVHILSGYVERGFEEQIRQSMHQLSRAASKRLEKTLFEQPSGKDVSEEAAEEEQHYSMDAREFEKALKLLEKFPFEACQKIELSYGGRSFKIHLDRTANVKVLDTEKHKVISTLPAARADEDAYHINLIKDRMKVQKREARKATTIYLKKLEQNLRHMNIWNRKAWEEEMSGCALHAAIAASFVWGVYDSKNVLVQSFYRDIEGNYIDASYEPVKLSSKARITLVHPLDLTTEELAGWSTFMAELEHVQPFEQLSRRCFPPEVWEQEKQWQQQAFDDSEDMSIALRKFPSWYATYFKGRYNKKHWFAEARIPSHDVMATLIVRASTWPEISEGVPHRTGLHLIDFNTRYTTANSAPWENYPPRVISDLLLTLHHVAAKFGKDS